VQRAQLTIEHRQLQQFAPRNSLKTRQRYGDLPKRAPNKKRAALTSARMALSEPSRRVTSISAALSALACASSTSSSSLST
jgi:hypothetical protein